MAVARFFPKRAGEAVTLTFDFGPELPDGVTVASAGLSSVDVLTGSDEAASAMLIGAAVAVGAKVLQRVSGGVVGTDYLVVARAVLSDGQVREFAAVLPVRRVF